MLSLRALSILALVALLALACSGAPAASPTHGPTADPNGSPGGASPTAPAGGVAGLLAALEGVGVPTRVGAPFAGEPLATEAVMVCLGDEPIRVYVFPTPEAAQAQAGMIDPRDPSKVGHAIIEWAGEPKFWLHQNVLVLYLGTDDEVEQWLLDVLGAPFAFGRGRPPLAGPDGC